MALFQLRHRPVENVFAFQFFFLEHKKEDPHVLIALLDPCCLSVRVSIDNGREMFDQAYCVLLVPHHHHHRHHPSILCLSASSSSSSSSLGCIELGGKIKKIHFTYWLTLFSLYFLILRTIYFLAFFD